MLIVQMVISPNERVRERPGVNISDSSRVAMAPVRNPGVGWQYLSEPRCWLEIMWEIGVSVGKLGGSLGFWRKRCLIPDRNWGRPNVRCRYLVGAHIGWDLLQRWSGELRQQEENIVPKPTSVGYIWSRFILVWDVWVTIDFSWGRWCYLSKSWGEYSLWLSRESVDGIDNVFLAI